MGVQGKAPQNSSGKSSTGPASQSPKENVKELPSYPQDSSGQKEFWNIVMNTLEGPIQSELHYLKKSTSSLLSVAKSTK